MSNEESPPLVPALRFPEFRGTKGWTRLSLGSIATFFKGKGLPKSELTPDGKTKCIHYGELFTEYQEVIDAIKSRTNLEDNVFLSKKNDVLMPTSDITPSGLAKACCVKHENIILGGDILVIRPAVQAANGEFLARQIRHLENKVLRLVSGSTVFHLYASSMEKLLLSLPGKLEQEKIAASMSSLDELIIAHAQKVNALRARRNGLMQNMFPLEGEARPRLRFPEFQNAAEWEERDAGSLFTNRITKGEKGLPIYSVTMNDGMVKRDSLDRKVDDIEDAAGNKKVCRNDIAYNMMRMWQGAMGVAPEDCLVSPAYIVLAPKKDVVPQFFQYMFKLPAMLLLLTSHSRGLTKDRLRLYFDDFARMTVRCPTAIEQQRIADFLLSLDDCIATQLKELEVLKTHKKGLMRQLFPSAEVPEA